MHAAPDSDSSGHTPGAMHGQSAKVTSAASGQHLQPGGSVDSNRSFSPDAASSKAGGLGSPGQKTKGKTAAGMVSASKVKSHDKYAGDFTIGSSVHPNAGADGRPAAAIVETGKGGGAQQGTDILKTTRNSPAAGAVKTGRIPAPAEQETIGKTSSANKEAGKSSIVGKKRGKKNKSARKKKSAQADAADGGGWSKVEQKSNAKKAAASGVEPLRLGEAMLSHPSMQLYSNTCKHLRDYTSAWFCQCDVMEIAKATWLSKT